MQHITGIFLLMAWIAGVVLAKGFWSILASIFIPFWAWYLVVEQLLIKFIL